MAARKPVRVITHGIERVDDYAWLRDPNWRRSLQIRRGWRRKFVPTSKLKTNTRKPLLAPLAGLRSQAA